MWPPILKGFIKIEFVHLRKSVLRHKGKDPANVPLLLCFIVHPIKDKIGMRKRY